MADIRAMYLPIHISSSPSSSPREIVANSCGKGSNCTGHKVKIVEREHDGNTARCVFHRKYSQHEIPEKVDVNYKSGQRRVFKTRSSASGASK